MTEQPISGRLKAALELMVWGGSDGKPLEWGDAARTAQISARSMRRSLERPAVRRYLMEQKEVLRACLSARNLFHLNELVSQRENKGAAVQAARTIEAFDAPVPPPGGMQSPGLTIRIFVPSELPPPAIGRTIIDVTPEPRQIEQQPTFKGPR